MKIINISFKNINNLKGEHSVDFGSAPLSTAGIFAIVGPTGSGKSSLLDVITLALFNRIPRFKSAVSKKNITDLGSVMTHHMDESSAAITYEIKGQRYTSSWSISKARTGSLRDYEMFIYDSSGTPLDLKKSEVPSRNEQIIGLKYDQFIKSIILSQGEFAKFLKADKNERGQLLENITGTSIYRKISIATYQKHKAIKEEYAKHKEVLGVIEVLSDEDRKEQERQLQTADKIVTALNKEIKVLSEIKTIKEEALKVQNELADQKIASEAVAKQILSYKSETDKLKLHDKVSPLSADLKEYQLAETNAKRSETHLKTYEENLASGQKNLQKVVEEMSTLCQQAVDISNFKTVMSQFEKKVNDLNRDLTNVAQKGREERISINDKKANYTIQIQDNTAPNEAITTLSRREEELKDFLSKTNLNDAADRAAVKEKITLIRTESMALKEITHLYDHFNSQKSTLADQKAKAAQNKKELSQHEPLLKSSSETLKALKENHALLLKSKEDAIKIANLEQLRQDLIQHEPCPLCGSTSHPYTEHLPDSSESDIDLKISKVKAEITSKEQEVNQLNNTIIGLNTSILSINDRLKELNTSVKKHEEEIKHTLSTYTGKEPITSETAKDIYTAKLSLLQDLESGIAALEELKQNTDLKKGYEKLKAIGEEYNKIKEQRNGLYTGKDVSHDCNELQDRFSKAKTIIEQSTTSIKKETEDLKGANDILKSLGGKLEKQVKALGIGSIGELENQILDQDQLQKIKSDQERLTRFQTENETQIKTLNLKQKELNASDKSPQVDLSDVILDLQKKEEERQENSTHIGELNSILKRDDDDKAKIKSKEEQLKSQEKELEKWSLLDQLIGGAKGDKFANFSQGLTLKNLIVYTNKRLQNLTDRYLVDRPTDDGALMVIDQYQGNIQRAVTTLSGGETFLISLALALSLSDMASKNVALDCLFIDEGFGTLDHDTLDIAMNTLEKLQSESQKTVGVISHVEALKERINVQIKLEKNAQGYSEIKVVS